MTEYDGGTYVEAVEVDRRVYSPPYTVHTTDGTIIERNHYRMAQCVAALAETFDDIDLSVSDAIPIPVAVDGKPAIAAYLYGVQERERRNIADIMDVTEETVRKYLNRFSPRRYS